MRNILRGQQSTKPTTIGELIPYLRSQAKARLVDTMVETISNGIDQKYMAKVEQDMDYIEDKANEKGCHFICEWSTEQMEVYPAMGALAYMMEPNSSDFVKAANYGYILAMIKDGIQDNQEYKLNLAAYMILENNLKKTSELSVMDAFKLSSHAFGGLREINKDIADDIENSVTSYIKNEDLQTPYYKQKHNILFKSFDFWPKRTIKKIKPTLDALTTIYGDSRIDDVRDLVADWLDTDNDKLAWTSYVFHRAEEEGIIGNIHKIPKMKTPENIDKLVTTLQKKKILSTIISECKEVKEDAIKTIHEKFDIAEQPLRFVAKKIEDSIANDPHSPPDYYVQLMKKF